MALIVIYLAEAVKYILEESCLSERTFQLKFVFAEQLQLNLSFARFSNCNFILFFGHNQDGILYQNKRTLHIEKLVA
jgi:hypothetical protein